jgi:TrpR-related protein YerC/YecD|tara:strand:+ start:307 stop:621 length:315 start_codon:yes stop_codon:yes gene_type:complete
MKLDRKYTEKQEREVEDKLFEAIKTLDGFEEYRSFFLDILTPAEFQAIKDRWAVAALLYEGYTYREINKISGVSITTVARVARFISNGSGGYQLALERVKKNNE